MKTDPIPLPRAVPGTEYIIDHIKDSQIYNNNFKSYGIMPGARIKLLFRSPSNDPCAYEIMGATLAIRREDSIRIYIVPYL